VTKVGGVLGLVILAQALSACQGKLADPSSKSEIAEADFFAELVQAACRGMGRCCELGNQTFSKAKCELVARTALAENGIPHSGSSMSYDSEAAVSCVRDVQALMSSCVDWQTSEPASCTTVFSGLGQPASSCVTEDDCEAPRQGLVECLWEPAGGRVCAVRRRGEIGQACAASCEMSSGIIRCDPSVPSSMVDVTLCLASDGLFCGAMGRCEPLRGQGETCSSKEPCVDDQICAEPQGRCEPAFALGEACTMSEQCGSQAFCLGGSCQAARTDGEVCAANGGCLGACTEQNRCLGEAARGWLSPFEPVSELCNPPVPTDTVGL